MQKTILFLCFIALGILLKTKFKEAQEINGVKKIILNLALPATIFMALLGIEIDHNLLFLPILALVLNLLLFFGSAIVLPWVGIQKGSPKYHTSRLLFASLAPGLSCFPFILEFLGETYLAKAAMADLGNKIFVLIILYIIAMRWYQKGRNTEFISRKKQLVSLLQSLLKEPVNLFITAALLLLGFGFSVSSLPYLVSETLTKLSLMMTPLVLLFIGLAVKIKKNQFFEIFSILSVRAGFGFLITLIVVSLGGITAMKEVLLILSFSLSSASFWPYAHICLVNDLEREKKQQTFDHQYAISILALSFPMSTALILAVLNSGAVFSQPINLVFSAASLFLLGLLFPLIRFTHRRLASLKLPKLILKPSKAE